MGKLGTRPMWGRLQITRVASCKHHDGRMLQRQPESVYGSKQKQERQSENCSKHFQKPTGHGLSLSIADFPRWGAPQYGQRLEEHWGGLPNQDLPHGCNGPCFPSRPVELLLVSFYLGCRVILVSNNCATFERHWAFAFSKCDLRDACVAPGGFRCLSTADPATCRQGDCVSRKTHGSKGIKSEWGQEVW